jgi:hypothetical protein
MKVHLQEGQQDRQGAHRFINIKTPISMNNNLQINPATLKAAFVFLTCMFLILHYMKV